jgi:hypothetical protein
MTDMARPEARQVSLDEFDQLVREVSNWGRWGKDDERGAMNLLTPDRIVEGARLVRSGRTVSMSLPWNTEAGPDNPRPALHYMTQLGDRDPGEPQTNADFLGSDFHGKATSHLDALCHADFRGQLYNGVPQNSIGSAGASFGSVMSVEHGIVGRGVLLDIPHLRGVDWLEPGTAVLPDEVVAAEEAQGVHLGKGDIVLLRSGHYKRRQTLDSMSPRSVCCGSAR